MSITGILEQTKRPESKIYGVVSGIVTNNQDPDKLGRVKVKIPRISGEDESNWARVLSNMSGKEMGIFCLPEIDDEVLVAFEYGDINMPYILGSLWNGKDKPPLTNDDGENNIRMIKSRSGHIIKLDDKDGEEKIEIKSKSGHIIRLDDKSGEEKIEIVDKTEKNIIVIDSKENKVSIKSEKDIEITAKGKLTIDAKDIEAKLSASAKIEASSGMDLKASGTMNIKGATVNIN